VEDLVPILTKFHRDILRPDIERIVAASEQRLRDEMHTLFDALSGQIAELRTEYHMLVAGLKRLEERMDRLDARLDKLALRSELEDLKARVDGLQAQVRTLEARLAE
jgi:chromosome segregation ATPase